MLTAEVIRKGSVMSSTCRSNGSQDTSAGKAICLGAYNGGVMDKRLFS